MKRDIWLLFGLALVIRAAAAWPQQQPSYFDAIYYYVNALNLANGRGFVEDFVWNYLGDPGLPPQPSHLYWMPLTSILAGWGLAVGGATYRAAQLPFILLSALIGPVSYGAAYGLTGQRRHGWLAGLFGIFSGFYFPFWTAIDNFTPFGLSGSLALLAAYWGIANAGRPIPDRESPPVNSGEERLKTIRARGWLFLSGLLIGLAHLSRADGPLLLAAIILVLCLEGYRRGRISAPAPPSSIATLPPAPPYPRPTTDYVLRTTHPILRFTPYILRFTLPLLLGYLLLMLPWFWRNWHVAGTPLPVHGSQTIWLADYDQLFSYGRELSAQTFFAQGIGPILQGRWWALTNNLQSALAVWGMIFLAPLALVGGWQLRRHLLIQLAGIYGLLLFIAMSLIFAFPGPRGGLFHSGAALLPFIYGAAAAGLDWAVDWAARRRRGWHAATAKQVFGVGLVAMAITLSSFIYYQRVLRGNAWNLADPLYPAIVAWVAAQAPEATVMIGNPPAYRYYGGGLSVVVPNEDLETLLQAAARYQVDYLVLDRNHPAPLAGLYQQPTSQPGLELVQTFGQGDKTYIFKIGTAELSPKPSD
jgi:hypothetical protein